MDFLERDLEDIVFNALTSDEGYEILEERGLDICYSEDHFICKRQLRIGNYGIADIVTFSRFARSVDMPNDTVNNVYIEVIELKRGEVNVDTYIQAKRYLTGIRNYMEQYHPKLNVIYSITLIGRNISSTDWVYLINEDKSLKVHTYKYGIDGIQFNLHGTFHLRDEGFAKFKATSIW